MTDPRPTPKLPDGPIRTPLDVPLGITVTALTTRWVATTQQLFDARHSAQFEAAGLPVAEPATAADVLTVLAVGHKIANEVTCSRWAYTADALELGDITWTDLAAAMGRWDQGEAVRTDFLEWITSQNSAGYLKADRAELLTRLAVETPD